MDAQSSKADNTIYTGELTVKNSRKLLRNGRKSKAINELKLTIIFLQEAIKLLSE